MVDTSKKGSFPSRVDSDLCKFMWCSELAVKGLKEDWINGQCQGHIDEYLAGQKREVVRESQEALEERVDCIYVGCDEIKAMEGFCGPHYNDYLEQEQNKKQARPMTAKQIKESKEQAEQYYEEFLEEVVDLEWWFNQYGEEELPAKFMNPDYPKLLNWDESVGPPDPYLVEMAKLSKNESMLLNERLKESEGFILNGHVWTFTGKKHYKREGTHNHFAFLPIET